MGSDDGVIDAEVLGAAAPVEVDSVVVDTERGGTIADRSATE
jgi:hypothetical protein